MRNCIKKLSAVLIIAAVIVAMMPLAEGGAAYAASVKINKKTVYIAKGSTYKLKVSGTKAKIKWSSSNKKIATVSKKGTVKAKSIGSCTITAKVKGRKYKCKVIVESKSANQARKLRQYILDKGKYDSGKKDYYISRSFYKEEGKVTTTIRASKKYKRLIFDWTYDVGTPNEYLHVTAKINLIQKASTKTGTYYRRWDDGYSAEPFYKEWEGTFTTQFDGKSKGLTQNMVKQTDTVIEEDEDGSEIESVVVTDITDPEQLKNERASSFNRINEAFTDMKPLLKKAGVTFNSIGFKNL